MEEWNELRERSKEFYTLNSDLYNLLAFIRGQTVTGQIVLFKKVLTSDILSDVELGLNVLPYLAEDVKRGIFRILIDINTSQSIAIGSLVIEVLNSMSKDYVRLQLYKTILVVRKDELNKVLVNEDVLLQICSLLLKYNCLEYLCSFVEDYGGNMCLDDVDYYKQICS